MQPARQGVLSGDERRHRVTGRDVTVGGGRYHVWSAGDRHAPAVLLIHGLGWDARRLWEAQMLRLADAGWHVLAPDLLGVGASAPLVAPRPAGGFAADMMAILAAFDLRDCAVVGFSMGGPIALALAALPGTPVRAAAICCSGGPTTTDQSAATEAMIAAASAKGADAFARDQAEAIWHPAWARAHPADVAAFVGWRAAMDQASLFNAFRSNAVAGDPVRPVGCPCVVIAADHDSFVPVEAARRLARDLGDADFVLIENSGHMVPIEQPDAFDAALGAFLERCWPAGVAGHA